MPKLLTSKKTWLRYSVAVGMAEWMPDDTSFDNVFKRADIEMYQNKKIFKEKYKRNH